MAWSSFGALPCRGKKTCWQLASRCCWNCARPWHASELVSFLVGLRTYRHPGTENQIYQSKPRFIHKMSLHEVTLSWLCRLVGSENRCGNTLQPSSGCFPRCNHLQGIFHFATIFRVFSTLQPSSEYFPLCNHLQSIFHFATIFRVFSTLQPSSEYFPLCNHLQGIFHFATIFRVFSTLQPSSGYFPLRNYLQGIFHFATIFTLQPSPADFPFYFHTNMFIGFYETLTPRSP